MLLVLGCGVSRLLHAVTTHVVQDAASQYLLCTTDVIAVVVPWKDIQR